MKTITDLSIIAAKMKSIRENIDTLMWRLDDRNSSNTIDVSIRPYKNIGNELSEVLSELSACGHIKLNEIDENLKFRS